MSDRGQTHYVGDSCEGGHRDALPAMSETPGSCEKIIIRYGTHRPTEEHTARRAATAHDAEDARRAEESDKRAVRLNLMISERDRELAMMRESENLALAAARDVIAQAREALRRLDEWDQMRMGTGDEPYWRREIAMCLAAIDALEVRA